jgi:hypothetical protein
MSFGESVFLVGFNQKTTKEDLFVKGNQSYPRWYLHMKTLEDSRRQITKAGHVCMTCGASQPMGPTCQPLHATSVLHYLKDCIFAVYSSQFDPRA